MTALDDVEEIWQDALHAVVAERDDARLCSSLLALLRLARTTEKLLRCCRVARAPSCPGAGS